eukprot:1159534-Pelagomonas_calceolata.AAC.5
MQPVSAQVTEQMTFCSIPPMAMRLTTHVQAGAHASTSADFKRENPQAHHSHMSLNGKPELLSSQLLPPERPKSPLA